MSHPLPANHEAERSLLGTFILDAKFLSTAARVNLQPEHFTLTANAEIYGTLLRMRAEKKPIDLLLLREELDVDRIGGSAYLYSLTEGAVAAESHVVRRCEIIKTISLLRRLLKIAAWVDTIARQRKACPQQIADSAIQELAAIRDEVVNGR